MRVPALLALLLCLLACGPALAQLGPGGGGSGGGGGGSGTVTTVSVATANGVSGTVANATTTPAITLVLGAITPSAVTISGISGSTQCVHANSSGVLSGTGSDCGSGGGGMSIGGTITGGAGLGGVLFDASGPVLAESSGVLVSNTVLTVPAGVVGTPSIAIGASGTGFYGGSTTAWGLAVNGVKKFDYGITSGTVFTMQGSLVLGSSGSFQAAGSVTAGSTSYFSWVSGGALTSTGIGQVTFGTASSGTPTAQTTAAQSGVGTNISGQNWTIQASNSTGSGTSADIIFQTGGSGAGAAVANTYATALTIKGVTQNVVFGAQAVHKGYTVGTLPTGVTGGNAYVTDQLTTCAVAGAALTGGGAVTCPVFYNGSAWVGG
jgi:hypothetical protein